VVVLLHVPRAGKVQTQARHPPLIASLHCPHGVNAVMCAPGCLRNYARESRTVIAPAFLGAAATPFPSRVLPRVAHVCLGLERDRHYKPDEERLQFCTPAAPPPKKGCELEYPP
jgi:hypothetical protein